jgi:hypothetical protein
VSSLDDLTATELRALAQDCRRAASRNVKFPATAATFLRMADRYEAIATQRQPEGAGARKI